MTTPTIELPFPIHSNLFSLSLRHGRTKSHMKMQVFTKAVNTRYIPETYTILTKELPSIFESRCFNDDELPFEIEVQTTEIGHLFEHILLEYLCELKLAQGKETAIYQGVTSWNWLRETRGVFHISITAGMRDTTIFAIAVHQAVSLMNKILLTIAYDQEVGMYQMRDETQTQNIQVVN